jgi:hypothetical protein
MTKHELSATDYIVIRDALRELRFQRRGANPASPIAQEMKSRLDELISDVFDGPAREMDLFLFHNRKA